MPKETIATNYQPTDEAGKTAPEWRLTCGWQTDTCDVQLGADNGDHESGQFFHLDRAQVNRLIRTLRKARDAAFGSDA